MRKIIAANVKWMDSATCAGYPSEWWTETHTVRGPKAWKSIHNKRAIDICRDCPVLNQCAEYVLHIEPPAAYAWGIYAALRPDQRNALRKAYSA